jgi:hypothetical protein
MLNPSDLDRDDNLAANLKGLVKMAWDVSNNIERMEQEIKRGLIKCFSLIFILYCALMVLFLPLGSFFSPAMVDSTMGNNGLIIVKFIGFVVVCAPLFTYFLSVTLNNKKLKSDIESEQDVLNQLLAVTFDIRRSVSYSKQKDSVLEFIEIDLDLKRLKFSASKRKSKKSG